MNQKGSTKIVLLIALVVALAGASGYVILVKQRIPIEQQQTSPTPAPTKSANTAPAVQTSDNAATEQRATITITSPKADDLVDIRSPMQVTWKTSSNFKFPQVEITVVNSNGSKAFDPVTVANTGSAMVTVPTSVGVTSYKILIQGTPFSGRGEAPFAYSGLFYFTGGSRSQMGL